MVHVVISSRVRPVVFRQTSVSGHPTRVFVCNYRDKAVCSLSGFTSSNSKNMPETLSEGGEDLGHASHESAIVKWDLEEPSEFRPGLDVVGKDAESFRGFYDETDARFPLVKKTYTEMHTLQTFQSVSERMAKWCKFDKCKMGVMDAVMLLDNIIDESDPDTALPNSVHSFQTAERIRENHPDKDWFHLTGLIHDVGKVLAVWGEPQYAVVGDTFPVGCAFSSKCVFSELFERNPDSLDPRYNTKYGIYQPNCGLENIQMSFGHDEFMYQVLKHNGSLLPEEALYCIRYHSFYPWHSSKDYDYLCSDKDRKMMKWVLEFNKYDLYSKADTVPDVPALKEYYQSLIDKYIPGMLSW